MKKLLVGALLLLSACAAMYTPLEVKTDKEIAWEYACYYGQLDCTGLNMPTVVLTESLFYAFELYAYGFYLKGEDYIYVRDVMDPNIHTAIMAHEMVHYILDNRGLLQGDENNCANEALAFTVSDKVAALSGNTNMIQDERWAKNYAGCEDYYE